MLTELLQEYDWHLTSVSHLVLMRRLSTISRLRLPTGDEWQLGPEPRDHGPLLPLEVEPKVDLSADRLTRAVHVITIEHVAWSGIAIWAVITRLLQLGLAPLAPYEARHALFEYDLVNGTNWASAVGYHPASAGWVHLAEAALFAAVGVSEFSARLIFALAGLLTIAVAFMMRRYIGRAGAIAIAGFITISPTFTYFSRASAIAIVVAALMAILVVAFTAFVRGPALPRAVGLGISGGLLCAAGPTGFASEGILLAALTLLGVYQLIATERPYIDLRIWLRRYGAILLAAIVAAGASWLFSQIALFQLIAIGKDLGNVLLGFGARGYLKGLEYYAPGMILYEFSITLTTIAGVVVIVCSRARSAFAVFSIFWLGMAFAFFLGSHDRESERLVVVLLPMVIVGAVGIDCLHHTKAWPYARVPVLTLAAATLYVQVLANFIHAAPVGNEPPWSRYSNLYWGAGATTIDAREQLQKLRRRFPEQGGTIFDYSGWQPSLRWYLRDFRPSRSAKMADVVVYPSQSGSAVHDSDFEDRLSIALLESWDPSIDTLSPVQAIRFIFTAEAWVPLRTTTLAITVHTPSDSAPTLIVPPP
jgi:hypothetical protein